MPGFEVSQGQEQQQPRPGPAPLPAPAKRHRDAPKLNSPFIGTFYKKTQHCARVEGVFLVSQFLLDLKSWCSPWAQGERRGRVTLAGPGPRHLSRCYLQRERPRSVPGGSSRNSATGKRCSCQEPFPSAQGWGGGGHVPQELGWVVQPNLSFGVTLGCPENPGRTMGGGKEGWLGWWHRQEHSGKAPLLPAGGASGLLGSWHVSGAESWAVNPNPVLQGGRWCLG